MVIKEAMVVKRLKELEEILLVLQRYSDVSCETLKGSITQRWIIERGMIAAANIIFDVSEHLLSGHFQVYPETYEDSLRLLSENRVISSELFERLRGLGGFRNLLVHDYVDIDVNLVHKNFGKALITFALFGKEILGSLELFSKTK